MITLQTKNILTVSSETLLDWCKEYTDQNELGINAKSFTAFTRSNGNEFVQVVDNDYRLTKNELIKSFDNVHGRLWASPESIIAAALSAKEIQVADQYFVYQTDTDELE